MTSARGQEGFTLVELLFVIAIIIVLASIIMPHFNDARKKARVAKAQLELHQLKTAFDLMRDDTGLYPNGESNDCRTNPPANNEVDLSSANAGLIADGAGWGNWHGPYVKKVVDPWGRPYYLDEDYKCMASTTGCKGVSDATNTTSVIVSCGSNGDISDGSCSYDTDNVVEILCRL